jgi:hypothetical protein
VNNPELSRIRGEPLSCPCNFKDDHSPGSAVTTDLLVDAQRLLATDALLGNAQPVHCNRDCTEHHPILPESKPARLLVACLYSSNQKRAGQTCDRWGRQGRARHSRFRNRQPSKASATRGSRGRTGKQDRPDASGAAPNELCLELRTTRTKLQRRACPEASMTKCQLPRSTALSQ